MAQSTRARKIVGLGTHVHRLGVFGRQRKRRDESGISKINVSWSNIGAGRFAPVLAEDPEPMRATPRHSWKVPNQSVASFAAPSAQLSSQS